SSQLIGGTRVRGLLTTPSADRVRRYDAEVV
ncbi:MAG: hypothetical protein ACI8XD_002135, partial [Thermoproteota archaeon]